MIVTDPLEEQYNKDDNHISNAPNEANVNNSNKSDDIFKDGTTDKLLLNR